MLTYNQEIPDSHIPNPNAYPTRNASLFVDLFNDPTSTATERIDSNQRSNGAKPNEKITPQIRARNLFLSIINILIQRNFYERRFKLFWKL